MPVDVGELFADLHAMLTDVLPFPIGGGAVPYTAGGNVPPKPYAILYPMPRPPAMGSMGRPHDLGWTYWQITIAGETTEQALWASDKVTHAMLDMDSGYVNEIPSVVGRELMSGGGVAQGSDNIYQGNDTYRLLVDS